MSTLEKCLGDVTDHKSCNFAATLTACMIKEFKKTSTK